MAGRGTGKTKKVAGGGPVRGNRATAPSALQTEKRQAEMRRSSPLSIQYAFTPANAPATVSTPARLPVVGNQTGPGVKDYPPPTQLFQSTLRPSPTSAHRPSSSASVSKEQTHSRFYSPDPPQPAAPDQSPPPFQEPTSPRHSRPSPHSSQAQNDVNGDEDSDEEEDQMAPDLEVEPTLSEEMLASVTNLLSQTDRHKYCHVLSPLGEPDTIW